MPHAATPADRPVFRFAPSPNGRLHLGHAFSALTTYRLARRAGGRFILRMEDIDVGRTRSQFVDGIFEDLEWLGLTWEEPVLRQSERFPAYQDAAERLRMRGVLYPCAATRKEISSRLGAGGGRDPDGAPLYQPQCGYKPNATHAPPCWLKDRPSAWRIHVPNALAVLRQSGCDHPITYRFWDEPNHFSSIAADPLRWGDAVIVRKDFPASYHLAVVVDDAFQGVTHVTRGQDLEAATDLQVLLQALLGLPQPVYHHHRLIRDASGRKLSKSAGDTSLAALRASGVSAAEIRERLGFE